jgi:hypothetical protein
VTNESYAKKLVALRHELEGDQQRLEEMIRTGKERDLRGRNRLAIVANIKLLETRIRIAEMYK